MYISSKNKKNEAQNLDYNFDLHINPSVRY
jgi:hypothetical protein